MRQLAGVNSEDQQAAQEICQTSWPLIVRLGDFAFASETVTQEGLAEHIKRIRNDYCKGSLRDTLNRFVPQPAGPRTAHIRVPEALGVASFDGTAEERDWLKSAPACRQRSTTSVAVSGRKEVQTWPRSMPVTVGHLLQAPATRDVARPDFLINRPKSGQPHPFA